MMQVFMHVRTWLYTAGLFRGGTDMVKETS
jgi:hypothetical protein